MSAQANMLPAPPGPAGSVGKRNCLNCGVNHPAGARFCWRCHAAVGLYAQHSVAPATDVPRPARLRLTLVDSAPVGRRSHLRLPDQLRTVVPVVGILLLAVASLRGAPYEIPREIAGLQRVIVPTAPALEDDWREAVRGTGADVEVGLYGVRGVPQFLVMAQRGRTSDADRALRTMAATWFDVTGEPVLMSGLSVQAGERGTVACAPFAAGGYRSMCAWADAEGFVGSVVAFTAGPGPASAFALAAREALRG